jgi:malate dehydrogenase (oxaloacetate-decarboxylating)
MSTHPATPSVSYSFTMRLAYPNRVGMLARIVSTIGKDGGDIGAVDIVASDTKAMTRDITVRPRDADHQEHIIGRVRRLPGVKVINVSDRVFLLHLGGKIAIQNKVPLVTRDALSMAYTPGVARVCEAIAAQPRKAWQLTIKGNSVAVVSDGTAVLGPGRHRPRSRHAGHGRQGDALQGVRRH